MSSPQNARQEMLTYVADYGLALLLTFTDFGLVWLRLLSSQAALQGARIERGADTGIFRCFLHADLKQNARADLELLLFSGLIIPTMLGDTLVVIFNLYHRMM